MRKYFKNSPFSSIKRDQEWLKSQIHLTQSNQARAEQFTSTNNCTVCDSLESKHLVSIASYRYHVCLSCNSFYISNRIGIDSLDLYSSGEYSTTSSLFSDSREARVSQISSPKIDFILDSITREGVDVQNWLDYGCGAGDFLLALSRYSFSSRGFEVDPRLVSLCAEQGLKMATSDNIKSLCMNSDVISLMSVLEHVENPSYLLSDLTKKMRIGSYLIIEVPRAQSLSSIINILAPQYTARHMQPPQHITLFSEPGLARLLNVHGFSHVASWSYGSDVNSLQSLFDHCLDSKIHLDIDTLQERIDYAGLGDEILSVYRKA